MPADVVVLEGIFVLHMEEIRSLLNMKVYVDTDDDVRLARRCGGGGAGAASKGGRAAMGVPRACSAAGLTWGAHSAAASFCDCNLRGAAARGSA